MSLGPKTCCELCQPMRGPKTILWEARLIRGVHGYAEIRLLWRANVMSSTGPEPTQVGASGFAPAQVGLWIIHGARSGRKPMDHGWLGLRTNQQSWNVLSYSLLPKLRHPLQPDPMLALGPRIAGIPGSDLKLQKGVHLFQWFPTLDAWNCRLIVA